MRKMDYVYRIEKNEPRVQKKGQGRKTKREQYANNIGLLKYKEKREQRKQPSPLKNTEMRTPYPDSLICTSCPKYEKQENKTQR